MSQPHEVSPPASVAGSSERLDSWKEIAAYLKRDVRTVQRWEKEERLPVHRHAHRKLGAIYAYKNELDAWWHNGHSQAQRNGSEAEIVEETAANPRLRVLRRAFAAVALIAGALSVFWLAWRPAPPRIVSIEPLARDLFWKGSLVTDGERLYYTQALAGRTTVVSAALAPRSGLPSELPVALKHPRALSASHNGAQLLLIDAEAGAAGELMVVTASDRGLRKVAGIRASCAAWSPDDHWIAFGLGHEVFRATDGGQPERLAAFTGIPSALAWSPDGRSLRVLLTSAPPPAASSRATDSLWLYDLDVGSKRATPVPLPQEARRECGGSIAWLPASFVLATRCSSSSALWVLPRPSLLARRGGWTRLGPEFGRVTGIAAGRGPDELVVLEDESGPIELVQHDPIRKTWTPKRLGSHPVELDYSRDGRWVAYVEYPQKTLWRARADGSEPLQLTFPPLRAQLPRWSPDGTTIAFAGLMPGTSWQVHLVGADGSAMRRAAPGPGDEGGPTWSPDGRSLIFGDIEIDQPESHFIRRVDLDTGRKRPVPGSAELRTARWSPDGRWIAAIRYTRQQLVLFDQRTAKWTAVASGVLGDTLNWSADGLFVYFDDPYEPNPGIYRFDVRKASVEPVVRYGPYRRIANVMNDTAGFSVGPDGSLLLGASPQSSRLFLVRLGGR